MDSLEDTFLNSTICFPLKEVLGSGVSFCETDSQANQKTNFQTEPKPYPRQKPKPRSLNLSNIRKVKRNNAFYK